MKGRTGDAEVCLRGSVMKSSCDLAWTCGEISERERDRDTREVAYPPNGAELGGEDVGG